MKEWTLEIYRDVHGRAPVAEALDALPIKDRARVARTLALLEDYGPLLKMPHSRHLQGKVWELREVNL